MLTPCMRGQDQPQAPPQPKKQEPLRVCSKEVAPPCAKVAPKGKRGTIVDPEYSEEARAKKISNATVVMWVVVETDGSVGKVTIESKAGYGLDEKAIEAIKQWRFESGRLDDNTPVPVKLRVTMNFRLY